MARWRRWLVPLAVLMVSIPLFSAAEAGLEYLRTLQGVSPNRFTWMFRRYLLPWAELALCVPLPLLLARRVPFRRARWLAAFGVHVLGSIAFGVVHLFLDVLIGKLWWNAPLTLFGGTVTLISWYLLRDIFIYWTIVGMLQALWSREALEERVLAEARLRADLATARLAALQARLEPHFLFNTLNTAVMLVRDGRGEAAVDVLLELSELLRDVVRGAPDQQVELGQELAFVRRYLALEQARFEDRLEVELKEESGLERRLVPFLTLQPLVENALRHGVARRTGAGPGRVTVSVQPEGEGLRLEVRDNGPGPDALAPSGNGVGLASVRARLRALYGDTASLTVSPAPEGGTVAIVRLPGTVALVES